jgi:hypothetical protein
MSPSLILKNVGSLTFNSSAPTNTVTYSTIAIEMSNGKFNNKFMATILKSIKIEPNEINNFRLFF